MIEAYSEGLDSWGKDCRGIMLAGIHLSLGRPRHLDVQAGVYVLKVVAVGVGKPNFQDRFPMITRYNLF